MQPLPDYGNPQARQRRIRSQFIGAATIVSLVFTCLYQWMTHRQMTETTNRAILRQDSLEAVKLSQDRIIFLMQDTILQLRKTNRNLVQQKK